MWTCTWLKCNTLSTSLVSDLSNWQPPILGNLGLLKLILIYSISLIDAEKFKTKGRLTVSITGGRFRVT